MSGDAWLILMVAPPLLLLAAAAFLAWGCLKYMDSLDDDEDDEK